ncbi:hypothetical protein JMJ77_0001205, partial [Colletotrichum scovillei]
MQLECKNTVQICLYRVVDTYAATRAAYKRLHLRRVLRFIPCSPRRGRVPPKCMITKGLIFLRFSEKRSRP